MSPLADDIDALRRRLQRALDRAPYVVVLIGPGHRLYLGSGLDKWEAYGPTDKTLRWTRKQARCIRRVASDDLNDGWRVAIVRLKRKAGVR